MKDVEVTGRLTQILLVLQISVVLFTFNHCGVKCFTKVQTYTQLSFNLTDQMQSNRAVLQ